MFEINLENQFENWFGVESEYLKIDLKIVYQWIFGKLNSQWEFIKEREICFKNKYCFIFKKCGKEFTNLEHNFKVNPEGFINWFEWTILEWKVYFPYKAEYVFNIVYKYEIEVVKMVLRKDYFGEIIYLGYFEHL